MQIVKASKISEPGWYEMSDEDYFADPCPLPSLNHTTARVLIDRSPAHAYAQHPRLGGQTVPFEDETTNEQLFGKALHALILGGPEILRVPYDDYRKKEAREFRDEVLAAGKIPLLAARLEQALAMQVEALPVLRSMFPEGVFHGEVVGAAKLGPTWIRAKLDARAPDGSVRVDYKTTLNAATRAIEAKAFAYGYDTQAVFYEMLEDLLDGDMAGRRRHLLLWQEKDPPYAVAVSEFDQSALDIAGRAVGRAIERWQTCYASGDWPAYPGVHRIAPKPWMIQADIQAEIDAEHANG